MRVQHHKSGKVHEVDWWHEYYPHGTMGGCSLCGYFLLSKTKIQDGKMYGDKPTRKPLTCKTCIRSEEARKRLSR